MTVKPSAASRTLPAAPTLSAVVPTLDEEHALPRLIRALRQQVDELVVVDGGSVDGTRELAQELGAVVLRAPRGRGPQLAHGAARATGELLCFLHADSAVPPGLGTALRQAWPRPWGCFAVTVDSPDVRLRLTADWMTRRAERTGACSGDMGLWFCRDFYLALGGFPPLAAFEDLVMADRARARIAPTVLRPALGLDPRRWQRRGVSRTLIELWSLRLAYRLGVPPHRLSGLYRPLSEQR